GTAESDGRGERTPEGTRQVISAGEYALFLTQDGAAYLSHVRGATAPVAPMLLDPFVQASDAGTAGEEGAQADEPGDADAADGNRTAGGDVDPASPYRVTAAAVDAEGRVALYSQGEGTVRWYDAPREAWR